MSITMSDHRLMHRVSITWYINWRGDWRPIDVFLYVTRRRTSSSHHSVRKQQIGIYSVQSHRCQNIYQHAFSLPICRTTSITAVGKSAEWCELPHRAIHSFVHRPIHSLILRLMHWLTWNIPSRQRDSVCEQTMISCPFSYSLSIVCDNVNYSNIY